MGHFNDRDFERQQYDNQYERQQYEDWHRYGKERGFLGRAADEIRSWFGDEDAERRRQRDQRLERSCNLGGAKPDWQGRNYTGSSPRGSRLEETGRYDEPVNGERWRRTEPRGNWGATPSFFEGTRDLESNMPYDRGSLQERSKQMDQYGRGPRNYRRSDERILDEINELLTIDPDLDATDIEALVVDGIVTLKGAVHTRHCKRQAEDIADEVYGVKEVHNELRVNRGVPMGNNEDSKIGRPNALSR